MELGLVLIFCIGIFIIGAAYGWDLREKYAKHLLDKLVTHIESEVQEDMLHIIIEKHNEMFYVYDRQTKTFMAQGKSKEELENVLHDKYPNKRFACPESVLKEVGFL